jgi:elongation factor P
MGSTQDLRVGAVLKYNGENCIVLDSEFRKPGKGGAFFKVKMRNLKTGNLKEHTYNSGENIDFVRIEKRAFQYLYKEGNNFIFMSNETYDQIPLENSLVGEQARFMKENQDVYIAFEGEQALSVEVPQHINLRVTYTEPGLKGDTATNASKPATLETGAEIKVPLFVNEGDLIRIDTIAGTYIERVKE